MKRMKRLAALALALCLCLLAGCGQTEIKDTLSVCVGERHQTLDPIYAEEAADQTILAHLYENLMHLESDGRLSYGMAKSVDEELNADGTVTYTFHLRRAKWSDGRAVQAQDFVYAWQRLVNPSSQSPYAPLLSVVVGYDEARAQNDMSLLQVTAQSSDTLVVVLDGQRDWFLEEVCTSPATMPLRQDVVQRLKTAADEKGGNARWWSDATALVTNGAYIASSADKNGLHLTLNENYYETGEVTVKELTFRYAATAEKALALYEEGTVDVVSPLPTEVLAQRAAEEDWTPEPILETYAVLFNFDFFQDVNVRKAMSMVIHRQKIASLADVTARAATALVPPGVPGVDTEFRTQGGELLDLSEEGYSQRCEEAEYLMEAAGHDNGRHMGTLEYLYVDEGSNGQVAEAVCRMWKETLNVTVTPRGVTEQELWAALRSGGYTLAGANLSAVCNDAECFLMKWTSDSPDNVLGYSNTAYDTLMAIIAGAEDGTARMGCLHDAEDLLITWDCAMAPLYTKGTDWQVRETLTGAYRNPRGWFCFHHVTMQPEDGK